jgi:type IV fimbrial biogenesis protein FimT
MTLHRAPRGVTLIELMVGLAIGALLLLAAAPFYGDYIQNSRLREAGHTLFSESLFAQSEAIKRNATVRVNVAGATVQTRDMSIGAPAGTVIREIALASPVTAAVNTVFDFGSDGRPAPFGTNVAVNLITPGAVCSADLRCPGLRVEAGGAARLCGNHLSGCD